MAVHVQLQLQCPYTTELIRDVLEDANDVFTTMTSPTSKNSAVLHWLEYEDLDFDLLYHLMKGGSETRKVLANSFCIRKGLLRKANFSAFLQKYLAKVNSTLPLSRFFIADLHSDRIPFSVSTTRNRTFSNWPIPTISTRRSTKHLNCAMHSQQTSTKTSRPSRSFSRRRFSTRPANCSSSLVNRN